MNYIIFDLEWNNAYSYAKKGFMNEIIEIGAVKLNERLEIVDTFKQLILPKITKNPCKSLALGKANPFAASLTLFFFFATISRKGCFL